MTRKEKIALYNQLVHDVNNCSHIDKCSRKVKMKLCENCNEVNLWTYWEGGRDRLDAEILVVGQDWGQIKEPEATYDVLKKAGDASGGFGYSNMFQDPGSSTNETLYKLLGNVEGCSDVKSDYYESGRKCKKVFFTNYVCCYREDNTSGKFDPLWTCNCKDYFVKLVKIIEPKIIVCLGRRVFNSVSMAAGYRNSQRNYNDTIHNGAVLMNFDGVSAKFFPVAHPGTMGTLNRCRARDNDTRIISKERGVELQCNDWKKIR